MGRLCHLGKWPKCHGVILREKSHLSNNNIFKHVEIPKIRPNVSHKDFHSPQKNFLWECSINVRTAGVREKVVPCWRHFFQFSVQIHYLMQETYIRNVRVQHTQLRFVPDMEDLAPWSQLENHLSASNFWWNIRKTPHEMTWEGRFLTKTYVPAQEV